MSYYNFESVSDGNEDIHFMKIALEEAEAAYQAEEIPIGAIVVCKNKVVGRGHNLTERLKDVTAHAEMQAMTAAAQTLGGKYLQDCTLYVTVEPCVMCAGATYWMQLARIVYGAREPKRGYLSRAPQVLHPKTQLTGDVLAEESAALMKRFFSELRR